MKRREFLKAVTTPVISLAGLSILGRSRKAWGDDLVEDLQTVKIWSYYAPLLSYKGILEEFEGRNPLDLKVIYDEVIKVTDRIDGRESDGTKNPDTFKVADLQNATESLRVHFWHDDYGKLVRSGHCLYVFKRYLADLELGKKIFVATGLYQSHFHVVMLEPS